MSPIFTAYTRNLGSPDPSPPPIVGDQEAAVLLLASMPSTPAWATAVLQPWRSAPLPALSQSAPCVYSDVKRVFPRLWSEGITGGEQIICPQLRHVTQNLPEFFRVTAHS